MDNMPTNNTTASLKDSAGTPQLGLHLGPIGRYGRIIIGAATFVWIMWFMVHNEPRVLGRLVSVGFGLVTVAYAIAHRLLSPVLRGVAGGWLATFLLLGPITASAVFDLAPLWLDLALGLYISVSLVLAGVIRYGGCEVVALPTLLTGRRMVAYCPWNAVDAIERPFLTRRGPLGWLVALFTLALGGYFVIRLMHIVPEGYLPAVDANFAWGLLLPAWYLLLDAMQAWRARIRSPIPSLLGSAVLLYLTAIFVYHLDTSWMWVPIMMTGATGAVVFFAFGHHKTKEPQHG